LLEVVNLACVRGDRPLFSDLSFALKPGELLHVVGANGTGKTTLLRTLCGLTRQAAGEIRWRGAETRALGDEFRNELAYVGHLNGIQGELTPAENLRAAAGLAGAADPERIDAALETVRLSPYRGFPAKILSQGQKRRLALARLVLLRKPLWILDEPFSALDVASVTLMTQALTGHLADGGMVVLTSHQDFEVEIKNVTYVRLDA